MGHEEFDNLAVEQVRKEARMFFQCFTFSLPDNIIREMNRKEYYAAMSWIRKCRRIVADRIDAMIKYK